jgi:hypothetical protein
MSSRVKRRYSTWPAPTSGWIPDEWKTYRRRENRAMSKVKRRRERQEREKQEHDDAVERTVSDFKPERPIELSKFIQGATEDEPGLFCEAHIDRVKDPEDGEWRSRRVLTLYLTKNWRNGVTSGEPRGEGLYFYSRQGEGGR